MSEITNLLVRAKAKIDTPATWAQGEWCRSTTGKRGSRANAVAWCSVGVLHTLVDECSQICHKAVAVLCAATEHCGGHGNLLHFNDSRTHKEVMLMWDKAIELSQGEVNVEQRL